MAFGAFASTPGRGGTGGPRGAARSRSFLLLPGRAVPGAVLPGAVRLADPHQLPDAARVRRHRPVRLRVQDGRTTSTVVQTVPARTSCGRSATRSIATVLALLFSYPLAYFIGVKLRRFPLWQALALTLVIAPFFISFLLRTLAWKQILSDEGPVVSVAQGADDPARGRAHHRHRRSR